MRKVAENTYPHLWPVGPGGLVAPARVIAAGRWESAPMRKAARKARAEGRLIDLTYGHACQWVIFLDTGHLVLATRPAPDFDHAWKDSLNDGLFKGEVR